MFHIYENKTGNLHIFITYVKSFLVIFLIIFYLRNKMPFNWAIYCSGCQQLNIPFFFRLFH